MTAKLSSEICKAARMLVSWSSATLSEKSGVPNDTIRAFESGRTKQLSTLNNEAAIRALETAGVQFIPENGGGAGVRLRDRK